MIPLIIVVIFIGIPILFILEKIEMLLINILERMNSDYDEWDDHPHGEYNDPN